MKSVKYNDEDRYVLDVDQELSSADEPSAESQTGGNAAELEGLRAERNSLADRLARQQAEFENFRKRMSKEQQDFKEYALENVIRSLLPILDSFDQALKAPDGSEFRSGVELINKQLHDALGKMGVEVVAATGQPFNPNFHQAIQMVETQDAEHEHVLEELQRGYKLKDRLLRPAMVRVAQNPGKK